MLKSLFFVLLIVVFFLFFMFFGAVILRSQIKNVNTWEGLKNESKNIILEIKDIIYFEATIHNPKGDILPDNLDDKIKYEIKERV